MWYSVSRLERLTKYASNAFYKCINCECKNGEIVLWKLISGLRVKLQKKLPAIYNSLPNDYEKRVLNDCEIANEMSYQIIKQNLINFLRYLR